MNFMSGEAVRMVAQFRTGGRLSGRFGTMNPVNEPTRTTRRAWLKG
jgi:hypothetical protein